MWAWIIRLVGGWIPLPGGGKPFGEYAGKIIWVVGIVLLVLILWNKFTAPTTNQTVQRGGYAITNNNSPKSTFGCASLRVVEYFINKEIK